jgi:hypothetical protein
MEPWHLEDLLQCVHDFQAVPGFIGERGCVFGIECSDLRREAGIELRRNCCPTWSACVAWWLAGIGEVGARRPWDRRALLSLLGFAAGLTLLLSAAALGVEWPLRYGSSPCARWTRAG